MDDSLEAKVKKLISKYHHKTLGISNKGLAREGPSPFLRWRDLIIYPIRFEWKGEIDTRLIVLMDDQTFGRNPKDVSLNDGQERKCILFCKHSSDCNWFYWKYPDESQPIVQSVLDTQKQDPLRQISDNESKTLSEWSQYGFKQELNPDHKQQ